MISTNSKSLLLGENVWSPINTQNTALTREAAMTYYYVRMGYPLTGMRIDRYGDILSGYFIQKCVKHLEQDIPHWISGGKSSSDAAQPFQGSLF